MPGRKLFNECQLSAPVSYVGSVYRESPEGLVATKHERKRSAQIVTSSASTSVCTCSLNSSIDV